MIRIPHTHLGCAFAAALAVLALASTARAQGVPTTSGGFHPPVKQHSVPSKDPDSGVPPPALPGSITTSIPADKTATDLPPTEALFDAINRGDIASARDALNRGADLNGRNILGMMPIDLSVDLSRNDITFLLLSMRGSVGAATRVSAQPGGAAVVSKRQAAGKPVAGERGKSIRLAVRARAAPAVVNPAPAPRQYAGPGDPGVPNPQAGFLGFGGGTVR